MLNRLVRIGVITACAVGLAGLVGGTAYAGDFDSQPYIVYDVPPDAAGAVVDLEDQFNTLTAVPISAREYLMNPVEKGAVGSSGWPQPLRDPDLHYRWFPLPLSPTGTISNIWVSNKIGNGTPVQWTIDNTPLFLLAPASKAEDPDVAGDPPTANHYTCYAAVSVPPAGEIATLEDQFGDHGVVQVGDARYLCAPVQKTKGGEVFPIQEMADGHDHLACYDIPPQSHAVSVNTNDQFGPSPGIVTETDEMLCLNSRKARFLPQPYIVYDVNLEPITPSVVDLADQFLTAANVDVSERQYLMNPAAKVPVDPPVGILHEEVVTDAALHYRWFPINVTGTGTHVVRVTNQFTYVEGTQPKLLLEIQRWELAAAPTYLLAPTSKEEAPGQPGPPPDTGHHYDCYEVLTPAPANATVTLTDQFGGPRTVPVGDARYLCTPVEKTNGGVVYPTFLAPHGNDHLACYDIPAAPQVVPVNTNDQFGTDEITEPETDLLLCVPTKKVYPISLDPGVPTLAPWGMAALALSLSLGVFWVARRRTRYGETA